MAGDREVSGLMQPWDTGFEKLFVMLGNEASSSPCIVALYIEEDSSLSLPLTHHLSY
jgi:hypothetical protein